MHPRRVSITGPAGSGKTTLAARVADALGVPHHDLDVGAPAAGTEATDGWVVEGAAVWDVDRFLEAADTIVWLDLPLRSTIPRIVRRHVRLTLLGRNRHRGLRLLWSFLRTQPAYQRSAFKPPEGPTDWAAHTRANHEAMLAPHRDRVVHVRTPAQARRWHRQLRRLARGQAGRG